MPRLTPDLPHGAAAPAVAPDPRPSRRDLFGGAAALLALPAAAAAATPHLDAELIAACDRFIQAEGKWRRLSDHYGDARPGTAEYEEGRAAIDAFADGEYAAAAAAVSDTQARTPAGLRAKALAVVAHFEPEPPDDGMLAAAMWEIVCAVAAWPLPEVRL